MLMGGWGMQRQRHGEQNPLDVSNASLYVRTNWLAGWWFRVVITIQMVECQQQQAVLLALLPQVHQAKQVQKHGWMIPLNPLSHWRVFQMCCSIQAKNSL